MKQKIEYPIENKQPSRIDAAQKEVSIKMTKIEHDKTLMEELMIAADQDRTVTDRSSQLSI